MADSVLATTRNGPKPKDLIGDELRKSLRRTAELARPIDIPRPMVRPPSSVLDGEALESLRTARAEDQKQERDRWERLHAPTSSVAESSALLAARTEQQQAEAKRQRVMTWLLAYVAVGQTVANLFDVGGETSLYVLLVTSVVLGLAAWNMRYRGNHEH